MAPRRRGGGDGDVPGSPSEDGAGSRAPPAGPHPAPEELSLCEFLHFLRLTYMCPQKHLEVRGRLAVLPGCVPRRQEGRRPLGVSRVGGNAQGSGDPWRPRLSNKDGREGPPSDPRRPVRPRGPCEPRRAWTCTYVTVTRVTGSKIQKRTDTILWNVLIRGPGPEGRALTRLLARIPTSGRTLSLWGQTRGPVCLPEVPARATVRAESDPAEAQGENEARHLGGDGGGRRQSFVVKFLQK